MHVFVPIYKFVEPTWNGNLQTFIYGCIEPNTEICKFIDKTWFIYETLYLFTKHSFFSNFTKHNSLLDN